MAGARLLALVLRQIAEDEEAVAEGLDGLEDGRHLIIGAGGLGHPLIEDHAVRSIDEGGAELGLGSGLGLRGQRRDHGIEQGQGNGRACQTSQECAAGQVLFGDDHCSGLLVGSELCWADALCTTSAGFIRIWNCGLCTIPIRMDENL